MLLIYWSNFQFSVVSHSEFLFFCLRCVVCSVIGPETLVPLSLNQSVYRTKTCHDLVVTILPRLRQSAGFYFEFLLTVRVIFSFIVIGRCDNFGFGFTKLNRIAPLTSRENLVYTGFAGIHHVICCSLFLTNQVQD